MFIIDGNFSDCPNNNLIFSKIIRWCSPTCTHFKPLNFLIISIYNVNLIFHIHAIRGAMEFNKNLIENLSTPISKYVGLYNTVDHSGHLLGVIFGSNPAGGIDVCLLCL